MYAPVEIADYDYSKEPLPEDYDYTVQVLAPGEKPRPVRCENPPAADALSELQIERYEVDYKFAGELSGALFSATASGRRIVVIQDYYRAAPCTAADGTELLYGVSARLSIGVSNFSAGAKLTLPFIAGAVEVGAARATYKLQVRGYVGRDKLAGLIPDLKELNVENYVKLMENIRKLQQLITRDTANIQPRPLFAQLPHVSDPSVVLRSDIGTVFALSQIAEGRSLTRAKSARDWPDEARDAIEDTYMQLVDEDATGERQPDRRAAEQADELLGGLRLR